MAKVFKPPHWVEHANIYEVNIRQYTEEGTFEAFSKHLRRLREMGISVLWFMPVTPISQKHRKGSLGSYYACSDYTSINPEFGTLTDFKKLVTNAHELGFKVIIDWVANHTGWDHRWTREHPDYYKRDPDTHDFKIASGMEDIIELEFDNRAMRHDMINAMQYWVKECDIDGFRCDLASWVTVDFWLEARKELEASRHLFWLGEFDELETPAYGEVFDASYSWKWMHETEDFYKKHRQMDVLYQLLLSYDRLGNPCVRAWFTSNHDENSWNGTEYEKYGNMAEALAVFSCTWKGIPLIYSGQELPLKTQRLKFFDKDPIPWTSAFHMNDFYKTLLQLHFRHPALAAVDSTVHHSRIMTNRDQEVLAFSRRKEKREVLVFLNFSAQKIAQLVILDEGLRGQFKNTFSNELMELSTGTIIELEAWGYLVFEK